MDKLNDYIPKPMPVPEFKKEPCITPACKEINEIYEKSMKQQPDQPISNYNSQQIQKK